MGPGASAHYGRRGASLVKDHATAGNRAAAKAYHEQLVALTRTADTERVEVARARQFLASN